MHIGGPKCDKLMVLSKTVASGNVLVHEYVDDRIVFARLADLLRSG
jgi:hypothetical protein